MTDVVYTAIYGGYDPLRPVISTARSESVRWICFTDDPNLQADGWDVFLTYCDRPAWLEAKIVKIVPHLFLPGIERSIWLDGSVLCIKNPFEIFDEHLEAADLGLFKHPSRDCLYREAAECRRRRKDHPERINRTMQKYRASHPAHWGLWMGGFLFRRHTPEIARFNEAWWHEICEHQSRRDQISLPYVLRETAINFATLPNDVRGEYFVLRPHARRPADAR